MFNCFSSFLSTPICTNERRQGKEAQRKRKEAGVKEAKAEETGSINGMVGKRGREKCGAKKGMSSCGRGSGV